MDDAIIIVDYDPGWPKRFVQEATLIQSALPDGLIRRIEHFGSTAVPGLAAKPIIDILIGVEGLSIARQFAVPQLVQMGYAFWADNPDANRLF